VVSVIFWFLFFPSSGFAGGFFQPTLFGGLGPALPEPRPLVYPQLSCFQLRVSSTLFGILFLFKDREVCWSLFLVCFCVFGGGCWCFSRHLFVDRVLWFYPLGRFCVVDLLFYLFGLFVFVLYCCVFGVYVFDWFLFVVFGFLVSFLVLFVYLDFVYFGFLPLALFLHPFSLLYSSLTVFLLFHDLVGALLSEKFAFLPLFLLLVYVSMCVVSLVSLRYRGVLSVVLSSHFIRLLPVYPLLSLLAHYDLWVSDFVESFKSFLAGFSKSSLAGFFVDASVYAFFSFIFLLFIVLSYVPRVRFSPLCYQIFRFRCEYPICFCVYGFGFRVFIMARVLSYSFIDELKIKGILSRVSRLIVYYGYNGLLYLYFIVDSLNLLNAFKSVVASVNMFSKVISVVVEEPLLCINRYRMIDVLVYNVREIEGPILRNVFADEEEFGKVLVLEGGRAHYIGLWISDCEDVRYRSIMELFGFQFVLDEDAAAMFNSALTLALPVNISSHSTPLKLRRKRTVLHGVNEINVSINLGSHILLVGKSGCGKSTALAALMKYITEHNFGRVLVFDWVGNFIDLPVNKVVLRPGRDVFLDLYGWFGKKQIIELYEEAAILRLGYEKGCFTPNILLTVTNAIDEASSHIELILKLREIMKTAKRRDEVDGAYGALRRLIIMNPDYYSPKQEDSKDLIRYLMDNQLVIIDLSDMPSEADKLLFVLSTLSVVMNVWYPEKEPIYIFIDEAHRLAPRRYEGKKEFILEFMAREARKFNIRLVIANQTFSGLSSAVIVNMDTIFIFNISERDELSALHRYFSSWIEKYKLSGESLRQYVDKIIGSLQPGECFMISSGADALTEPIPVYWKPIPLAKPKRKVIDEGRFREAILSVDFPRKLPASQKEALISKAKEMILEVPMDDVIKLLRQFEGTDRTVYVGKYRVLREGRLTLPAKIYLRYYGIKDRR